MVDEHFGINVVEYMVREFPLYVYFKIPICGIDYVFSSIAYFDFECERECGRRIDRRQG